MTYHTEKARVVALLSGTGSNLMSLVQAARTYEIVAVLSDRAEAPGLLRAAEAGISAAAHRRSDFKTLSDQKQSIYRAIREFIPDFVALAGYMQIVEPEFAAEYFGRLVNIHPSLLPEFPGLKTHERALAAGVTEHGCTVHLVDSGVDTGPIISQATVPVREDDTAENLAARVLEVEHALYPWTLNALASGEISTTAGIVAASDSITADARKRSFRVHGC